jgi:hypothetical protein
MKYLDHEFLDRIIQAIRCVKSLFNESELMAAINHFFNEQPNFRRIDDVSPFIPIVKKMAGILKYVEVFDIFFQLNKKLECEYISQPETKECLLHVMEQLMEDLNNYSECQIPISTSLYSPTFIFFRQN